MELEFIFSEVYHNNLNRFADKKHEWSLVKIHCENFVRTYKETFPKILLEVQNVTNKPFKFDEKIKVYLVGWEGKSFSNPLTLNAKRDLVLMLTTLCHEILHITFKEESSSLELEEKINNYVEQVFKNLNMNVSIQLELMRKFSRDKYNKVVV